MALTKVKLISDGVIVQGNLHSSHGITTAHIGEGSNLYYTDARADARIAAASTSDLSEGSNLYYTDARADARITAASTSDLSEGTNLYYTDARADARVALIVDSSPATLNTLNELAAALGDDPNFATTTATSIGLKAPLLSPSFNSGATNVVASFTSTDGTAGIALIDNSGNVELSAAGNTFQVQPAGGAAALSVSATASTFAGAVTITQNSGSLQFTNTGSGHASIATGSSKDLNISSASGTVYINSSTTFSGRVNAGESFGALKDGADTVADGPFFRLTNAAQSRQYIFQLDASNNIDYWYYNGSAWTQTISLLNNGGANFTNSISAQGMVTITQNDIGNGEGVGLRIIRSGGAQIWNITSGMTGVDNTTFNIRNSTSNTNVLSLNASNNNATFAGTLNAGATTLSSGTNPLVLTLNSTASGYGGILFQYGGATKGLSYYNSNMMIFGGEAGIATRLQAGGQYILHADATNQNVHIGGTGNSAYKLQVTGTSYTSANAQFQSSVGIGLAPSADAKLEILNGNFRIRGSSANVIQLSNTAGNTRAQLGNYGNEGDLSLWRSNNVKTVYISSYYDGYINNDTNKFGFGTTAPKTKLHVEGPTGTKNRSTTGGSSVYETTKYWGVSGNSTANISIDTPTVFPPMAAGGFILVEVSASGYGNSGSNGLVFSYITGGYGGHYAAVNQPYHPVVITANSVQAGTCTWYNPDATTIGITVTTTNSAGMNGLMRVKVTTTY